MKLVNKDAGMEIGVVYVAKDNCYWLYKQVGKERTMFARFGSPQRAKEFLRTLVDRDAAGGNDGGMEE